MRQTLIIQIWQFFNFQNWIKIKLFNPVCGCGMNSKSTQNMD